MAQHHSPSAGEVEAAEPPKTSANKAPSNTTKAELQAEIEALQSTLAEKEQALAGLRADHDRQVRELSEARQQEQSLSRFNDVLRWKVDDTLPDWGERVLTQLTPLLGGLQSTLYVVDYAGNESQQALQFVAGYAHNANCQERIPFGRGLMGQVAISKRPFYFSVDDGLKASARVQAGLLTVAAKSTIVYPLLHNNQIEGVIEVTALQPLDERHQHLLSTLADRIGVSLSSIRNQLQVSQLYEEAQEKSRKLQVQEEELRQNIEQLNTAQEEMRAAKDELAVLNSELEERVKERTRELESAMESLQSTQDQLVMSEKMAALGQLVAGVAHEINSPIGAIKASATTMTDTMSPMLIDLQHLVNAMSEDEKRAFNKMTRTILENEAESLTSREERKLRKQYEAVLEDNGVVDESYDIASDLIGAGFHGDISAHLDLLTGANGVMAAQVLNSLGQLRLNLDNINLAVDKTKKVVYALKSYAYQREQDELVPFNLLENLETVLTIYHNQIKYGIDLQTHFEQDLPEIPIYPDALSQVWTNLIQNAIQAMQGEGQLVVELFRRDEQLVVAIQDSGPGIPAENQARIFEPFFTTKKQGEGTGLGLDICKKIVDKHSGDISVDSEPGRTRFEVSLPIAGPAEG